MRKRTKHSVWFAVTIWIIWSPVLLIAQTESDPCRGEAAVKYRSGAKVTVNRQGQLDDLIEKFRRRREFFESAIALCPVMAEAHVNLADALENLALLDLGKNNRLLDLAVHHYRTALELNKLLIPAHIGLGDCYAKMGLYDQASRAYSRALELQPANARAKLGMELVNSLRAGEASGFLERGDIVNRLNPTPSAARRSVMGVSNRVVIKARQRFDNLLFDEWSDALNRPETLAQLTELAQAISSMNKAGMRFIVEGHTDDRGDKTRNEQLSQDRADAVKGFLAQHAGIEPERIHAEGLGFSRPRAPNDGAENWARNRRVEVVLIEAGDAAAPAPR